jgi:hypothetical protein
LRPGEARLSAGVDTDETDYSFSYPLSIPESGVITRDISVGDYDTSLDGYVDGVEAGSTVSVRIKYVFASDGALFVSTYAQPDGYYRMDYILPGAQKVIVTYHRNESSAWKLGAQVDLRDGETVRQDFDFENVMGVRGYAVLPSSGLLGAQIAAVRGAVPIDNEGQLVEAINRASRESSIVGHDRGDYMIQLDEPGVYTVLAVWYYPSKPANWASRVVTIEDGQTVVVDFEP